MPLDRRFRDRGLLLWLVGTALWLSVLLIAEAEIRPAPGFAVMAPLLVAVPGLGLALVLGLAWRRGRR